MRGIMPPEAAIQRPIPHNKSMQCDATCASQDGVVYRSRLSVGWAGYRELTATAEEASEVSNFFKLPIHLRSAAS